ncbi:hypothetical protein TSUD_20150 [Trifolium subterraneum]|uniref:WAT1-related protein n=1 Tax=Trifolium subterraneum TaxID=3900 RepID=A0A2Z6NRR7_TRISU|nr:hypothetical protein TSUD_20150 [Trifolium subterraneum]
MSPYVYVTYRHVVAAFVMFPFAYFLERNVRPKLTFALFMEFFVLSVLGVSLTLNMYFASLKFTSPTFIASMVNSIAALTFIIAVALRFEVLDLGSPHGIAKVLGTIISLAAQSAVFTVIAEYNNPSAWGIGLNIELWSTIYGGIVVSGLLTYIQLWCTEKKGPVFVTLFNPLSTIFVAILAYSVLGEKLYLGSIIGAFIVIIGLYMLLWGKEYDIEVDFKTKDKLQCYSEDKECRI